MTQVNFNALRDLHDSANYLLHIPEIQASIVQGHENCVEKVSESSLRMLDVCSVSKDVFMIIREHLQDLQLTLRDNESNVTNKMAAYNRYRSRLKKETLKCLQSLKGIKCGSHRIVPLDQNLLFVMEVLKEVRKAVISVVESLLSLISIPWFDKRSGWVAFSSMFRRSNERVRDDVYDEIAVQSGSKRLEAAEIAIEELEVELDCMFRRLIRTRVSLLNLLTI